MRKAKDYSYIRKDKGSFTGKTKTKKLTQNYDIIFQSKVSAANTALSEHRRNLKDISKLPYFVDNNGILWIPSYAKVLGEKEDRILKDYQRTMRDIAFMKDHEEDIREGRCFV